MFLTEEEKQQLTGYKGPAGQRRALDAMGIRYRVRPDGRPMVTYSHVMGDDMPGYKPEPNFDAIDEVG